MNQHLRLLSILLLSLLTAVEASATKPCPPSPCYDNTATFKPVECAAVAEWIAVGAIENVSHDRQGFPMNKDFASFRFRVSRVERGKPPTESISFTVGWCDNRAELPADTAGEFRFYGTTGSEDGVSGAKYLGFERVGSSPGQ